MTGCGTISLNDSGNYLLDTERAGEERPNPGIAFPQFSRYESNLEPHVNLVCVKCGKVMDATVGQETVVRLKNQISSQSNFLVAGQRVDFHGWCASCAAAQQQSQPSPA